MQRLLDDASKISGIKYDISSFSDVTQAIHVMQESMGIAGTTSKEASTTIQGSINSMKSAWNNFLVGLSSGKDIGGLLDNLVQTAITTLGNLIPIIQNSLTNIINILPTILQKIVEFLPQLLVAGQQIITSLLQRNYRKFTIDYGSNYANINDDSKCNYN